MAFFGLFNSSSAQRFISPTENQRIVAAIRQAEKATSGEVRVYIESKCKYVNPMDRAAELFFGLKMDLTDRRNAVLVYIAFKHQQFALFADEGIYQETGPEYWNTEANKMLNHFRQHHFSDGLVMVINDIGQALQHHFPFDQKGDKNELTDEIVFGK